MINLNKNVDIEYIGVCYINDTDNEDEDFQTGVIRGSFVSVEDIENYINYLYNKTNFNYVEIYKVINSNYKFIKNYTPKEKEKENIQKELAREDLEICAKKFDCKDIEELRYIVEHIKYTFNVYDRQ